MVLAASGLLGGATTPVGAHSRDGEVRLLLVVLAVVSGGSEHREQLQLAVYGCSIPVSLVGQGADVLVVVLCELQADSRG